MLKKQSANPRGIEMPPVAQNLRQLCRADEIGAVAFERIERRQHYLRNLFSAPECSDTVATNATKDDVSG